MTPTGELLVIGLTLAAVLWLGMKVWKGMEG